MRDDDGAVGGSPTPADGALVERTGLVVAHEGERIVPKGASRAGLRAPGRDAGAAYEIVFPVEIEVHGAATDADADRVAELVLRRLTLGLLGT